MNGLFLVAYQYYHGIGVFNIKAHSLLRYKQKSEAG